MLDELVVAFQCDRDAAIDLVSPEEADRIASGNGDGHHLVQAFARHRIAGRLACHIAAQDSWRERVQDLRALMANADPLPWRERDGYYRSIQASPEAAGEYGAMVTTHTGQIAAQQGRGKHNTALIVAAVNAFPELVDHLEDHLAALADAG